MTGHQRENSDILRSDSPWSDVVHSGILRSETMRSEQIFQTGKGYTTDYGVLMLGVLFCSIPTMIIFFVLQKQFAEGITGAVK